MVMKASPTQQMPIILLISDKDSLIKNWEFLIETTKYSPSKLFWKNMVTYLPTTLMIFLLISSVFVGYQWKFKNVFSKRMVVVILVVSVLLIGLIEISEIRNQNETNNYSFPPIDEYMVSETDLKLNPIFARLLPSFSVYQYPIKLKDSLINIAHIVKANDTYSMTCEYGKLSNGLKYNDPQNMPVFIALSKSPIYSYNKFDY